MSGVAFRVFPKELFWLAPFACLALVAAAAWRPPPVFPTPARTRLITDAKGVKVNVPLPFRTVIRYGGRAFWRRRMRRRRWPRRAATPAIANASARG